MDTLAMWSRVVAAEERVQLTKLQLTQAEAGQTQPVIVAELRKRAAGAMQELARAQFRWERQASGSPKQIEGAQAQP